MWELRVNIRRFAGAVSKRSANYWLKHLFGLLKLAVFAPVLLSPSQTASAQPAQIILIRHAEKPKNPSALHLSSAGERRARELVYFFQSDTNVMQFGRPVALFATEVTKNGGGQRTKETLEPLSSEWGLPIQTPYKSEDYAKFAKLILRSRDYAGKTVIVCWTREHIPQLVEAFGIHPRPEKLDEDDYGRVYVINFKDGKTSLEELRQPRPSKPAQKRESQKQGRPRKKDR